MTKRKKITAIVAVLIVVLIIGGTIASIFLRNNVVTDSVEQTYDKVADPQDDYFMTVANYDDDYNLSVEYNHEKDVYEINVTDTVGMYRYTLNADDTYSDVSGYEYESEDLIKKKTDIPKEYLFTSDSLISYVKKYTDQAADITKRIGYDDDVVSKDGYYIDEENNFSSSIDGDDLLYSSDSIEVRIVFRDLDDAPEPETDS